MRKLITCYQHKDIDMLQLGYILPILINNCEHKSTDRNFYQFEEADDDLLEKIPDVVGDLCNDFARKAVVDQTFIRKSLNISKSIMWLDASQVYLYAMCQSTPTSLYTWWDLTAQTSRFTPHQNKTRSFENKVMSFFQPTKPDCKIDSFHAPGRQTKIDYFHVDGFCFQSNSVFEARGCFYHFCTCREVRPYLTEEDIQRCSKKEESPMKWDEDTFEKKASVSLKSGSVNDGNRARQAILSKNASEKTFHADVHLQLSNSWKQKRKIKGYIPGEIEVPKKWKQVLPTSLQYSRTP